MRGSDWLGWLLVGFGGCGLEAGAGGAGQGGRWCGQGVRGQRQWDRGARGRVAWGVFREGKRIYPLRLYA